MFRTVLVILALLAPAALAQTVEIAPEDRRLIAAIESGDTSWSNIRTIQRQLFARGYRVGLIDGIYGKRTQEAVARWQQDRGYPVSGLGLAPGDSGARQGRRACGNGPIRRADIWPVSAGGLCR